MKLACMICGDLHKATEKHFPLQKPGKKEVHYCVCNKNELEHVHHRVKNCKRYCHESTREESYIEGQICKKCIRKHFKVQNSVKEKNANKV